MSPCPDEELFSAYADGELPEDRRAEIAAHLDACPRCRATVRAFAALTERVAALDAPALDAPAKQRLWERVREAVPDPSTARPARMIHFRWTSIAVAAAAVLLFAVIVLWPKPVGHVPPDAPPVARLAPTTRAPVEVEVYDDSSVIMMAVGEDESAIVWFFGPDDAADAG